MRWMRLVSHVVGAAFIALAASTSASAQKVPIQPPPEFPAIDDNGVELTTGYFTLDDKTSSVGDPDDGGLVRTFLGQGRLDNLTGVMNASAQGAKVSIGYQSESFVIVGGQYVNQSGSGTLTYNTTTHKYTYTGGDGTVAVFDADMTSITDGGPVQANAGLLVSLTRPSGETLTYTYNSTVQGCGGCWRIQAVTSNLGYMVKYEYNSSTQAGTLSRIVAINLANDYCVASAASCSYTRVWSYKTFTGWDYGPDASVFTVTDSLSRTTTFTFTLNVVSANKNITQIQRPNGVVLNIAYDDFDRVTSISNGVGTWTYAYTAPAAQRLLVTITDPLGHTRGVTSDTGWRRVVGVTNGVGQTVSYTLDPANGRVTRVTQPEGDYVDYVYDARANITSATHVAKAGSGLPNRVTTYSYDATCGNPKTCNKPNSISDLGGVTSYTYDPTHGGVLTITEPAGANGVAPKTTFTYTSLYAWILNASASYVQAATPVYKLTGISRCVTLSSCVGTADEQRTTIVRGSAGVANNLQMTSATVQAGDGSISATTSYTYNIFGDVRTIDGPLAGAVDTVRNRYDTERVLTGRVELDPDAVSSGRPSVATRYNFNAAGQVTSIDLGTVASQSDTDWLSFAVSETTAFTYDGLDRKVREARSVGGVIHALTQLSYDNANRLDCQTVRMNTATFGSPPASACTLGTAGSAGPDRITRFEYDNADRLTGEINGYGTAVQRYGQRKTYRANGAVETWKDGGGNLTTYEYDGFDRLAKIRYPVLSPPGSSSTSDFIQKTYDNTTWTVTQERRRDGQLVNYSYDARRRVTSKTLPSASYTYDNFDQMRTATEAGQTVGAVYDALGRRTSETGPLGTVGFLYNAAGQRTRLTWPDGFYVTYDLDYTGAITAVRENGAASGAGVLATLSYDNLGRRSGIARGNAVSTTVGYGPLSRLQTLTQDLSGTSTDQTLTFTHNPAGQILTRTSNNASYAWNGLYNVNRTYAINGLNQVTASGAQAITYDARGNLASDGASTYGYDVDNRLTSTTAGAALVYDGFSRLYQTTSSGGAVTRLAYDGDDLIAEYSSGGSLLRRYVGLPKRDEALVWYEGSGTGDRRWLVWDNQGSVVAVTNGSGASLGINTYDEYGIPGASNLGRFQYTGQTWLAEVGLYHYKARAYSPTLGRFMQTDPSGYDDGLNLYAYVLDDPVNKADPTGKTALAGAAPLLCVGPQAVACGVGLAAVSGVALCVSNPDCRQAVGDAGQAIGDFTRGIFQQDQAKPPPKQADKPGSANGERAGKPFTRGGKEKVKEESRQQNGGQTTCVDCGEPTNKPKKTERGDRRDPKETNVDHIIDKANGGDGSPSNGAVRCLMCNIFKPPRFPPNPGGGAF